MRTRYTEEQKAQALASIQEKGVVKTGEEMGISIQTLYKWKSDEKSAGEAQQPKTRGRSRKAAQNAARKLLSQGDDVAEKLAALQAENTRLREMNLKLRKALAAMLDEE